MRLPALVCLVDKRDGFGRGRDQQQGRSRGKPVKLSCFAADTDLWPLSGPEVCFGIKAGPLPLIRVLVWVWVHEKSVRCTSPATSHIFGGFFHPSMYVYLYRSTPEPSYCFWHNQISGSRGRLSTDTINTVTAFLNAYMNVFPAAILIDSLSEGFYLPLYQFK